MLRILYIYYTCLRYVYTYIHTNQFKISYFIYYKDNDFKYHVYMHKYIQHIQSCVWHSKICTSSIKSALK